MTRNLRWIERGGRLIIGVALLGLFGALTSPWKFLTLIGLIPLGTALTGHCPVYHAFRRKKAAS
jgi:hypothetical protein